MPSRFLPPVAPALAGGLMLAAALLAGSLGLAAPAAAQQSTPALDPGQKAAIEGLIHDYLLAHPEVIVEAVQKLKERQQAADEARQQQAVKQNLAALRDDPKDPVLGNPDGDITVVEFFDYQCGYCKHVAPGLQQEVKADGRIRMVMKEFPILGPASIVGAKAALAAKRQGKYQAFHWAMMQNKAPLDDKTIYAIAAGVGLDLDKLKADMADPAIEKQLSDNYDLAEKLDIRGTPAFVIGDQLVPGALPMEQFRQMVKQARQG
ncbi:Protein-disulfide isomerase [Tistlia consotensis]|uniref:Protein-disulfide isomerase n=1 Tax=Tistlia consotensis USBA 355 TaxID=560819 RepID=A0A1Y6CIR8_9PROT|nr:DsbA family protein [Tistlia consotensis]SMF67235.1 Protein-disulfide isomerase [Tistlia consotensis USBA 355]SNS00228.1 Protein-disulfide isomerase [Tistlia consotensis]